MVSVKLTDEQWNFAVEVAKEWKGKVGNLKLNKEDVTEGLEYLYRTINKPLPKIVWVSSPLAMQSAYQSVKDTAGESVQKPLRDRAGLGVGTSVVDSMLKASLDAGMAFAGDIVWIGVTDLLKQGMCNSVREFVEESVGESEYQEMGSVWYIRDWLYLAKLDCSKRIGIKHKREVEVAKILKMQSAYDYLPYENVVIVCEHPMYPPKEGDYGWLHSEGTAAIEWEDGFKVWYLNGVRVPQYLAETPAEKLDLDWYLQEKNIDVKVQFIWKYGLDRIRRLGKVYEEIDAFLRRRLEVDGESILYPTLCFLCNYYKTRDLVSN